MLTFLTTAKPFRGHDGIIQRNALKSWTLQHPDVEVILFGNEEGAAEAAKELGLRHEPHVERNEFGTKRLDYMFCRAQAIARHALLCYINCDIVLMQDFWAALKCVRGKHSQFLVVARHRVYSYMRACSALVLGYHHLHLFDDARKKRKEWMPSSSEKTLVALPAKAKAAAGAKS